MNKTSYFGNRFASALRGFRSNRKSSKQLAVASTPAASEFEALESRILLSGIGTGLNKKQVTFIDADGDKVTVKSLGKGAKFNIDLGGSTNNADIANIEIGRDGTSIGISVAPVGSFTKPTQTKAFINPNWDLGQLGDNLGGDGGSNNPFIGGDNNGDFIAGDGSGGELSLDKLTATNQKIQTQYYNLTPGYTNVGSITAADGITEVGSIGLTAVVVPVIDLPGVAIGNINLSTGQIAKVDAFMATNGSYLDNYGGWTSGIQNINIYDINAGSIAGINIAGYDPDFYNGYTTGNFEGNNYLGVITTDAGGIGRLTGTNSEFKGQLSLGGTDAFLGNTVLKEWAPGSIISAEGDLTFNAKDFNGVIEVGGHLNLGLQGKNTGTFVAGDGISGLRSTTTDAIVVSTAFSGDLVANGGDIADITIGGANGNIDGALIDSANKIGTIWSVNGIAGATILAGTDLEGITLRGNNNLDAATKIYVGGTLGLIDLATGNLDGTISATNFDEVLLRGGNLNGTLLAKDGIGDVTLIGGSLTGDLIAQGDAGIGAIDVTNLTGGEAIADGAVINSAKDITSITATTTGGTAIGSANIQAAGTLGPIEAIAYGGGAANGAIDALVLIAPTIGDITASSAVGIAINNSQFITTTGNVGSITATGFAGGISGGQVISAGNVGAITGTAVAQGSGITGLTVTAQTGINNVIGKTLGTGGAEYGIGASTFTAVSGNIGNITGSTSNPAGAGSGVYDSQITAVAGTVGNVTGTAAGSGTGLNDVGVQADKGIGTITGSSFQGNGIDGGLYKAINGDIEAVTATTSEGIAITGGATFESIGGTIKSVTATPTGVGGQAVNEATFRGATIGNLSFAVTNLAGGLAVNDLTVEATNGNVGTITVTNASLDGAATGLTNSNISATGNIGQVTVSAVGDGANAIVNLNLTADSEGDETGDVAGVTATSKSGSAIVGGAFEGANVGAIKATVTSLAGNLGIDGLDVTATKGNIGSIEVTTEGNANTDHAISGGTYKATGNVGPINVSANAGNGLENLTVTADEDGDDAGDIVSITATSETGIAINGPAPTYKGANIGAIVATVTGDGGPAIQGEIFIATAGNIASVTASTAGEGGGDHAIVGTLFLATGNVGPITVSTNAGIGLNNVRVTADSDTDDAGDIGNIQATSDTGSGIVDSKIKGANIGSITAKVTGDGNDAIDNSRFEALAGNIGAIVAETASETSDEDAIDDSFFLATGNLGPITVTANTGDGLDQVEFTADTDNKDGGNILTIKATSAEESAIQDSTFTAANIGNIEAIVTGDGAAAIRDSKFTANGVSADGKINNGTIGTIQVTSASETDEGIVGTKAGDTFFAAGIGVDGDAIGNITVALTKSTAYAIQNVVLTATFDGAGTPVADQKAKVGTVTTTGENLGIDGLEIVAPVSIGAITSSGTDDQSVNLDAPTSGALIFNGLADGKTVTVDATAKVTTLGAITVEAPGGTPANSGNLTITGATAVTTLGAIAVDGELTLPSLTTVKTASTIGAFTIGGGNTVGTGLAGSSIGLVTIGDGSAGVNNVTFEFATMNGKTNATADATLAVDFLLGAGPDITTLQAKSPGTTVAGVTAILV